MFRGMISTKGVYSMYWMISGAPSLLGIAATLYWINGRSPCVWLQKGSHQLLDGKVVRHLLI